MDGRFLLVEIYSHPWVGLSINKMFDPWIGSRSIDGRYPRIACNIHTSIEAKSICTRPLSSIVIFSSFTPTSKQKIRYKSR